MSSRRIRSTINNSYIQPMLLGTARSLVITPSCNYNSILFTKKHKSVDNRFIVVDLWAKFDAENFDGIQIVANISKKGSTISSSLCTFDVYYLSIDNNWTETLVFSGSAAFSGSTWKLAVSQNDLGSGTEVDGERSFKIMANITRNGKIYKKSIYLNHLGIYESFFKLKQEVEFLDLTKKDE